MEAGYFCTMSNFVKLGHPGDEPIFCVYFHLKEGVAEVFYVGIGSEKRAFSRANRSKFWHHVVEKHGYDVLIEDDGLTWAQACELEKKYIAWFGRRIDNSGTLVNLTPGGDGVVGMVRSAEYRAKISAHRTGTHHSKETKAKLSKANKGNAKLIKSLTGRELTDEHRANISKVNKGKTLSPEHRAKQSAALMGRKFNDGRGKKISERLKAYNAQKRAERAIADSIEPA